MADGVIGCRFRPVLIRVERDPKQDGATVTVLDQVTVVYRAKVVKQIHKVAT